mmetsp:Transcript_17309/g.22914  ORF Transcript_17309/g.22914 Transcript_17309/m.22914 type:complete len:391 (-) Transcript_17309:253-1425(-)
MPTKPKNKCTWPLALAFMSVVIAGLILLVVFLPIRSSLEGVLPELNEFVPPEDDDTEDNKVPQTSLKPSRYEFMQCPEGANIGECCNGLESNCGLRVDEMMFATGHNLMSSQGGSTSLSSTFNHIFPLEGSNETDQKGALDFGYRGINLDVCECGGQLKFCHNLCINERDPAEVFSHINDFLDDNPSEVVIINFQIVTENFLGTIYNVTLDGLFDIMQGVSGFVDKIHVLGDIIEWPLMRELVEDREQIIIFHHNGPTCGANDNCPSGLHYYFDYVGESDFEISSVSDMRNFSAFCPVDRGNEVNGGRNNLYAVNHFLKTPYKNVALTTNENNFIEERIAGCEDITNLRTNMVIVDFWSLGDLPEFTQETNKARAAEKQGTTRRWLGMRD